MPCKTKASPEEMLDQIASYLYQVVTITQAAENLHMSRITCRKWVLRYKEAVSYTHLDVYKRQG